METPQSILEWGAATFGSPTTLDLLVRCNKEMAELLSAINNQAPVENIRAEIADVTIVIWQAAASADIQVPLYPGAKPIYGSMEMAVRVSSLLQELIIAFSGGNYYTPTSQSIQEASNLLYRMAAFYEADLQELVDAKMVVNRARQWELNADGSFQHVEGT